MTYNGTRVGGFSQRGPVTRAVYKIPGRGLNFCCDPRDAYGEGSRRGFKDWRGYELA